MDKYIGKKLDSRYEIHDLLGIGGMAMVYKAYDIFDDRTVAIKILKDEFIKNPEFLRRFRNESKAIAVLSHPNIVKVYDVSFGDKIQYIVMEYIDGITLKDYIERQQIVNWKESVHFIVQVLRALQHAHEKGIIHRDIKPQNILLLKNGTIKVTDFGIARFTQNETRTMTDKAIGSVHYIAPEQARGDLTDYKADIYSMGVMLYEMLTGKLPFEADSAVSVAIMQLQTEPKPLREINVNIPCGLEEITLKAMQKDTSKRYSSAADMLNDIELFRRNPDMLFNYNHDNKEEVNKIDSKPEQKQFNNEYEDNYLYNNDNNYSNNDDGDDEEEYLLRQHKKSSNRVKLSIGIAVVLIAAVIAILFATHSCEVAQDVNIPDFVGQQYSEVMAKKDKGEYTFKFNKQEGYDISKPDGIILDQSPKTTSGKKIKSNSTINLVVNVLGEDILVPDVAKQKQDAAVKKLENVGFVTEIITVYDDDTPAGIVISTDPAANTGAKKGTTVKVYVSSGPANTKTQVPNVINISLDSAKKKIEAAGLKVGNITTKDSSEAINTVLESDPLPTTSVSSGTAVNLVVSSGKPAEKSVDIHVKLPAGVNKDMNFKVYIDGSLVSKYTKTINPSYSDYTTFTVTGTGKVTVVVTLDDQKYWTYNVNLDNSTITDEKNPDYKPPK